MYRKKIRTKPIIFIVLLLVALLIGGTYAYFSSISNIKQKFKSPTYNIELINENTNTWGNKKISILNNESTNTPVIIRINYNETWSKKINNNLDILNNQVNNTNVVNKEWTTTFINDFIRGDDGWYYYKKILNPNEEIEILNSISLNDNLISTSPDYEKYLSYDYEIAFNYEAIQADTKAVQKNWKYNITITNNDIDWNF